jgi:hypothetical protein
MKTKILNIAFFALLFVNQIFAQDVTTVRANNSDISDNLDLKAVASIFGESRDLEDFERRLNDPEIQISNLDLNGDNRVDYLRVIEATENNTHLIIIQSVLGIDTFQDVATVEVERDRNNNVQVQVVGDVYMYGQNYIYEPVYVTRPIIYDVFWASSYRPYYSPWYWGYYPTYYTYWSPYPVYRYRNHIHVHINTRNTYHYVDSRRSSRAIALHNTRRSNAYERQHPDRSFSSRNDVVNRHALVQNRTSSRSENASRSSRNSFTNSSARNSSRSNSNAVRSGREIRTNDASNVRRANTPARTSSNAARSYSTPARSQAQPAQQSRSIERSSTPAVRSTPARSNNISPVRSTPARSNNVSPTRSTPSMRSAPAAPRQSAPSRSSGGNSGRSSRG